jgi:hypothetical protein
MDELNPCNYCDETLVLGDNWTDNRKKRYDYTCSKCASAIATGKMSRTARIRSVGKPGPLTKEPDMAVTPHHLEETMGVHRAAARRRTIARVNSQMTPEIMKSLAKPMSQVIKTINLRE